MTSLYTLSICIPTYNFGAYIGQTLDSILAQIDSINTEIVIIDGASTDNTQEIVKSYQQQHPNIKYYPQQTRGGIDHDMSLAIELSKGEYCWLFSADDIMEHGAYDKVSKELSSKKDIYLLGFSIYSKDMLSFKHKHPILNIATATDFNLSNPKERLSFFKNSLTTTAFFSFISSLVIKRSRWLSHPPVKEFYGSCWAHVARLFSAMPDQLTVRYLPESFLKKRSDNDSFMDRGFVHRLAISIEGFHNLANRFFGFNTKEAAYIRRAVRKEVPLRNMIKAHLETKTREEKQRLSVLLELLYIGKKTRFFFLNLAYKSTPKPIFNASKKLYRFIKSHS